MLRELSRDQYHLIPVNSTTSATFTFVVTGISTDFPEDIEVSALYSGRREPSGAIRTMFASEPILARDWLTPEEDEAWERL